MSHASVPAVLLRRHRRWAGLALVAVASWLFTICPMGAAEAASAVAATLPKETGVAGGLALVLGAADLAPAVGMAAHLPIYVQVLQPDAKLAAAWSATLVDSPVRHKVGVREAALVTDEYGSDLFNVILVETAAALGKATPAEVARLLTPGGLLLLRQPPAAGGPGAGLVAQTVPGFAAAFRKPATPRTPAFCDSLKWRAGARAHWASGWRKHGATTSVFYYSEKLEQAGDAAGGTWLLQVRDPWNGRLLWTMPEAWVYAASEDGRLFLRLSEGDLGVCDARTGTVLTRFPLDGFEKKIQDGALAGTERVILWGAGIMRGYSTDGKELWRGGYSDGGRRFAVTPERLFTADRTGLTAWSCADGKQLWNAQASGNMIRLSDKQVHLCSGNSITTFDPQTGKQLWQRPWETPKPWIPYALTIGSKFHVMRYYPYPPAGVDSDLYVTTLDCATGEVLRPETGTKAVHRANMCAPYVQRAGSFLFYWFNVWVDPDSMKLEFSYLAHPSCFFGTYLGNGLAYNFPSRKSGPLMGVSASAPADLAFDQAPGGALFRSYAKPSAGADALPSDWVMFRADPRRSNATAASAGTKLSKRWEIDLALPTATPREYGRLCSIRSGLTQPVSAYGLVIVADLDGQRIVAVDAATGAARWKFHVGSRVEFSPTLYKGLCLFTAKDGFVYALQAATGSLCWKRLLTPRTRLIGGQDALEELCSVASDVMIEGSVAFASAGLSAGNFGGVRAMAFRPESGDLLWSACYPQGDAKQSDAVADIFVGGGAAGQVVMHNNVLIGTADGKRIPGGINGNRLRIAHEAMNDYLAGGVSPQRNGEDRQAVQLANGIVQGKTIAFDDTLSVAYFGGINEKWDPARIWLQAKSKAGKENLWEVKDDLIVDDLVLTPDAIYAVGHHYSTIAPPELRVLARDTGATLASHPLATVMPAWNGMSVAGGRVLIATGDGKLICFAQSP